MFGITVNICIYICATLLAAKCVVLGQHHHHKPWPTYSLQNMPQTRFTCHDKILGGYYADAETQCQMFHVCVKVAGGVQDFRFLCPNSTAFDQEAQICADWGDVDCEQSVLYYGSDNFDLYRIGSGFESKRAPLAEEEEATFHLQRAESADTRRSKETRVDQKLRPDQPPNYTKHFGTNTRTTQNYANLAAQRNPQKNTYNNYNNDNNNNNYNADNAGKRLPEAAPAKQPIVNYYTPTTSTTTTTTTRRPKTTTTTTERFNNNDESRQDLDEIFKGSHSSHYFANRNGGREDDFQDHSAKAKPNDFNDYSRKLAETSTSGKTRVQPTRGQSRRIQQQQQSSTPATTNSNKNTTPTTTTTKFSKKFTLQTYYQTSDLSSTQYYKTSTQVPTKTTTTTTTTTTARPLSYGNANSNHRFSLNTHDYQTQEKIIPTTYNPANSVYRYKTTTPKSIDVGSKVQETSSFAPKPSKHRFYGDQTEHQNNNAANQSRRKLVKSHIPPQNSTYVNHKEFAEFSKILTPQEPHPFKPAQVFRPPPISKADDKPNLEKSRARASENNNEPQYFRSRSQPAKSSGYQEPAPFSAPTLNQRVGNTQHRLQLHSSTSAPPTPSSTAQPRGFTSRGKINYKATTQREDYNDNYTPTSFAPKKFSTLVPKEHQYQPTTFKPTTYKKAYESPYLQQTVRPANKPQKLQAISTTTQVPTTVDPYYNPDEDDGQYHPELYEQDFPKNRLKQQRSTTTTGAPPTTTLKPNNIYQYPQSHLKTQQQSFFQKQQQQQAHRQDTQDSGDLSDEDELFKTAHSLNFGAASVNKLRADILKAEKTSQQYNSQYLANQQPASPTTAAASYLPTTSTTAYSYPTYAPSTTSFGTTTKPFTAFSTASATTTYSTTTRRPTTSTSRPITTTTLRPTHAPTYPVKSHKTGGKKSSGGKPKKSQKSSASKRPPHADEDTSYDYAYYDSDTLSESPQEYPEYEIPEFTKTRKN